MMRTEREIDMNIEMNTLIANIKKDYFNWTTRCAGAKGLDALTEINERMIADFNEKLTFKTGSKYIKIFSEGGSVWGFVVNTDKDKKFKMGDILKAAGYNAPARNAPRGNIIDGGYTIQWTGPLYLSEIENEKDRNNRSRNDVHDNPICSRMVLSGGILNVS